jgi:hypothetical protein
MNPGPFTAAASIRSTRNRRRPTPRHPYTTAAAILAALSAAAGIVAALNL